MPPTTYDAQLLSLETAAHESAFGLGQCPPTPGQCAAGNYKVGRYRWAGMDLCIEQPQGSIRSKVSKSGKPWQSLMAAHYGYIAGTRGADGDQVDCFIGAAVQSTRIFVVNQGFDGRFDEHKVMLAFDTPESARSAYLCSYERGWPGLQSLVECSIPQLQWWLKYADLSIPMDPKKLPYDGAPMQTTQWDDQAMPVGASLDAVIYGLRQNDGPNGLLVDCVSMAEITADPEVEAVLALDALATPFSRLEHKMTLLRTVMDRVGPVTTAGMQVSDPFKRSGTVNVAVVYELSDGQTISVFLHNPDATPAKLAPTDELISWKWLLNKKDVTIVVAPEHGQDLNVREVARRLMRLADKNSAMFQRANASRAQRMGAISSLRAEVEQLEKDLATAQSELEVAKLEAETRAAQKPAPAGQADPATVPGEDTTTGEPVPLPDAGPDAGGKPITKKEALRIYDRLGNLIRDRASMKRDELAQSNIESLQQAIDDAQALMEKGTEQFGIDLTHLLERGRKTVEEAQLAKAELETRTNAQTTPEQNTGAAGGAQAAEAYDFRNVVPGGDFQAWVSAAGARESTAIAMDKAALELGGHILWFAPAANLDSASLDASLGHAIAALAISGSIAQTNGPIHAAEGDMAQAELSAATAQSTAEAIEVLRKYESGRLVLAEVGGVFDSAKEDGATVCGTIFYQRKTCGYAGLREDGKAMVYLDAKGMARLADEDGNTAAFGADEAAAALVRQAMALAGATQATQTEVAQPGGDPTAAGNPVSTDEPVQVSGDELGVFEDTPEGKKQMRDAAKSAFEAMLGEWVDCPALQAQVQIRRKGIKKVLSASADARKLKLVPMIKELIRSAKMVGPEKKPYHAEEARNMMGYQVMRAAVRIDQDELAVRFVLGRDENGRYHYDHTVHQKDVIFDSAHEKGPAETDPSNLLGGSQGCAHSRSTVPGPTCLLPAEPPAGQQVQVSMDDATGFVKEPAGAEVLNLFIEGEVANPDELEDEAQTATTETAPAENAFLAKLRAIAAGDHDAAGLAALYAEIQEAVNALSADGQLEGDATAVANEAITHWGQLDIQLNG